MLQIALSGLGGTADDSLVQYGQAAAAKVLQAASAYPPDKRADQIKRLLNSIDGSLWPAVNKLVKRGAPWQSALATVFSTHVVQFLVRAGGGGALSGLGIVPRLTSITSLLALDPSAPADGACTADGQFIWRAAANGIPGHWERKNATEQCTLITDIQPMGNTGAPGGVTVTPSSSIKVGPFVFGLNRDGSATTWSYDSYDKLSAEQAKFIHDALASKPGDGAYWRPVAPSYLNPKAGSSINNPWIGGPGSTTTVIGPTSRYGNDLKSGSGTPGTIVAFPGNATYQWPAKAPWGGPWLTWSGWLSKFGFAPTDSYNVRYLASGKPRSGNNNDPIAAFTYPVGIDQALAAMTGTTPSAQLSQLYHQKWGLYVWLQPVGPVITSSDGSAPGATPNMPLAPLQDSSYQLNVTAMPLLPGASWFTELAGEFYSGVIDIAGNLSDLLCTVAQNPAAVSVGATAIGGPAAGGAAAAGALVLQGKCGSGQQPVPQVTPPVPTAKPTPWGYIIAAGVAAIGAIAYFTMPPAKKAPAAKSA